MSPNSKLWRFRADSINFLRGSPNRSANEGTPTLLLQKYLEIRLTVGDEPANVIAKG